MNPRYPTITRTIANDETLSYWQNSENPKIAGIAAELLDRRQPIKMIIHCPQCNFRHIDRGEFAAKPHHTHSCQNCGSSWRPAIENTVGVHFLPGFSDHPEWHEGSACPHCQQGKLDLFFENNYLSTPYLRCSTCERRPVEAP